MKVTDLIMNEANRRDKVQDNQAAPSLAEWDQVTAEEISLEEMDALVREMARKWAAHESLKEQASALYLEAEAAEAKVVAALKAAKKDSYKVDGLGTVSLTSKLVYRVPGTIEQKKKLFNFIRKNYGDETLMSMLGINHNTLNSFCTKEAEKAGQAKENFALPGLELPTSQEGTRFTKAKAK